MTRGDERGSHRETHSSAGSGAAAAAAAAVSPGGGCSAGTAFEDLAGVDVGDTLFVGDPWKKETDRDALLKAVHQTGRAQYKHRLSWMCISPLLETWKRDGGGEIVSAFAWNRQICCTQAGNYLTGQICKTDWITCDHMKRSFPKQNAVRKKNRLQCWHFGFSC